MQIGILSKVRGPLRRTRHASLDWFNGVLPTDYAVRTGGPTSTQNDAARAKPERRHALRSPTLYGLMASGQRLDQGSAQWEREMVSAVTGTRWKRPSKESHTTVSSSATTRCDKVDPDRPLFA